jgi:hypothetical protein
MATADLAAVRIPGRNSEGIRLAEAVIRLLDDGAPAVSQTTHSYPLKEQARSRGEVIRKALERLGTTDIHITLRQDREGRWRWYAYRAGGGP